MRRLLCLLSLYLFIALSFTNTVLAKDTENIGEIIPIAETEISVENLDTYGDTLFFIGNEYCPACQNAESFLEDLEKKENIIMIDVRNQENHGYISKLEQISGRQITATPTFIRGEDVIVGFNTHIASKLRDWVGEESEVTTADNYLSDVDASDALGLIIMTTIIGIVDGFNPCSIWALLFLITIMSTRKYSKKQTLGIGFTYILTIAFIYGLFISGFALISVNILSSFYLRLLVLIISIFVGVSNILVSFDKEVPFKFSIQDNHKKEFLKLSRSKLSNNHTFFELIVASIGIGVFASLIELPCTAGFPIIWNSYMQEAQVVGFSYFSYLSLYLFLYVIVEVVLLFVSVLTIRKLLINERSGYALKFGMGLLMVFLGISFFFGDAAIKNTFILFLFFIISALGFLWRFRKLKR